MRWLVHTPLAIIEAMLAMIEPLEAAESLLASDRALVGSGAIKPEESRAARDRWRQQAEGPKPRRPAGGSRALPPGMSFTLIPKGGSA